MFNNLSENYKSIIEHRIDTQFFIYHDIGFWNLDFSAVESFDINQFSNERNILILNGDIQEIKNIEKFRKLVSSCYVFSKHNLLKLYGIPESTFYFNCLIDDAQYYISNNNDRTAEIIYNQNNTYQPDILNECKNFVINLTQSQIIDKNKLLYDVVGALCCGCSVFIDDVEILNNLDIDDVVFVNKSLDKPNRLKAQEHFHFKYGYIYQSAHIRNQLVGILGDYM